MNEWSVCTVYPHPQYSLTMPHFNLWKRPGVSFDTRNFPRLFIKNLTLLSRPYKYIYIDLLYWHRNGSALNCVVKCSNQIVTQKNPPKQMTMHSHITISLWGAICLTSSCMDSWVKRNIGKNCINEYEYCSSKWKYRSTPIGLRFSAEIILLLLSSFRQ